MIHIKQYDLEPRLGMTLRWNGAAQDLTGASEVILRVRSPDGSLWTRALSIVDAAAGEVALVWQAGDTDLPGLYEAEVVVTWPSGNQTWPNRGYVAWRVEPAIPESA